MHGRGIPDDFRVEAEILVHDDVAQARRTPPVDGGLRIAHPLRELFDRLPNNQLTEGFVSLEAIRVSIAQQALHALAMLDDIGQIERPVTGHG
jgi:hypothetical protein